MKKSCCFLWMIKKTAQKEAEKRHNSSKKTNFLISLSENLEGHL